MSMQSDNARQREAVKLLGAMQREIGDIHGEPMLHRFRRWRSVRSPDLRMEQQPHDPTWAGQFDAAAREISTALVDIAHALHHVGSTSVPGLDSKPIIDMLLPVQHRDDLPRAASVLVRLGYADWGNSPGHPDADWYWHSQREPVQRVVHLCVADCPWLAGALNFRDYLRAFPAKRDEYAAMKRRLVLEDGGDNALYSLRKSALLFRINLEANGWRAGAAHGSAAAGDDRPGEDGAA